MFKELQVHALVFFLRLIGWLPLPVMVLLGTIIGEIAYWIHAPRRAITKRNISACFPHLNSLQVHNLARKHFHSLVIGVMVMALSWWTSKSRLERICQSKNRSRLKELIDNNENIILLAPHFTSLEFLAVKLFSEMKMTSMYQKHKNPDIDHIIHDRRSQFGTILYNNKSSLNGLVKLIRQGIPFYYLPDQDPGKKRGVFAPFFGIQTATFPTLSKLSRLGNAKVLPCMAKVKPFGLGIEIIFDAVLEPFPTGDVVQDVTAMNKAIENLIAHAPEQYFWSHKRFKTRPDGEEPFY